MEFILAFFLGLRHGIDIDHVAAISDITSSQVSHKKGIEYTAYYVFGHGVVVMVIGSIGIFLGTYIPKNYDRFFEILIGITLIILGLYVLISLFRSWKKFKIKSRWMIIFSFLNYAKHRILHQLKIEHTHPHFKEEQYSRLASFFIGIIHGLGAETPTQVIALSTISGVYGGLSGLFFLLLFSAGIFISNILVALLILYGFLKASENFTLYVSLGLVTAIFSLIVGVSFLFS